MKTQILISCKPTRHLYFGILILVCIACAAQGRSQQILTPPSGPAPRVNGPTIFGVRPGSPFLYSVPATGAHPMTFSVDNLPLGLILNASTGLITGKLTLPGEYRVVLHAANAFGEARKSFRIEVGEHIGLTPAMGWNSWNAIAHDITQERILRNAQALVASGLKDHGFTYINVDDCWQGTRGGPFNAIQGNELFPDMQQLADDIHALGLKFGVYSTPWTTSYAGFPGGSSDNPDGKFTPGDQEIGKYSFAVNDAKQWAAWGVDYNKEDWNPSDIEHTREIYAALRASGRDIALADPIPANLEHAAEYRYLAQSWRVMPDILDVWDQSDGRYHTGISEDGFALGAWAPYTGPGGFADADMLVVGRISMAKWIRQTRLTPDEQYSHISLWAMLSSPMIIGADLEHLDSFTLSLLSNDEVLDVDQDALGKPADRLATIGGVDVFVKDLEDGSHAVGFFNRSDAPTHYIFNKLDRIGLSGIQHVRDLWRQKNLPDAESIIPIDVPAHGVLLYKFTTGPQSMEATASSAAVPPPAGRGPSQSSQVSLHRTSTSIDSLPGWSAWKPVNNTDKIEYRSRLFNANIKPGCGIEFRALTPHAGYTVDATIARFESDLNTPATGNLEMLGVPVKGAFVGQFANGSIPLHFTLFPDGKPVSYFDLHWRDCDEIPVFVRVIEPYRAGN